jgi:hypothetical protein
VGGCLVRRVCVRWVQRGMCAQFMACLRASCLIDKQKRCWWYRLLQREGGTTRKPDSNRQRKIEGSGGSESAQRPWTVRKRVVLLGWERRPRYDARIGGIPAKPLAVVLGAALDSLCGSLPWRRWDSEGALKDPCFYGTSIFGPALH